MCFYWAAFRENTFLSNPSAWKRQWKPGGTVDIEDNFLFLGRWVAFQVKWNSQLLLRPNWIPEVLETARPQKRRQFAGTPWFKPYSLRYSRKSACAFCFVESAMPIAVGWKCEEARQLTQMELCAAGYSTWKWECKSHWSVASTVLLSLSPSWDHEHTCPDTPWMSVEM